MAIIFLCKLLKQWKFSCVSSQSKVQGQSSAEMGWYGAAAESRPSQLSLAVMHPPFGFNFLVIDGEKKKSRNQVKTVFLCCCWFLLMSDRKAEMVEEHGSWTALPLFPQKSATSCHSCWASLSTSFQHYFLFFTLQLHNYSLPNSLLLFFGSYDYPLY